MKPERWEAVERLYNAALELEPGRREAFLDESCAGDETLRKEVVSLLACQPEAEGLLQSPALEAAAKELARDATAVPPADMTGRTIAHYRVLEKIGEGGMGVVYRGLDTRLRRDVAIKVLPDVFARDVERKARFEREARLLAALKHPNIVTIHDIGQADGIDYIAMEFVVGKTLEQLIPRKGMRLSPALTHVIQIADALTRAHGAGIIHRDLKPSNVMVDEHGLVKVLDFGLAKLTETSGQESEIATARTGEGTILGTAAYMSPEQAEGRRMDARSDIFSFGSMLYEMLTGQRAFRGDTRASTVASIPREEPKPISQVVEGLPPDAEKIVKRCLRKDPDHRFQHMDDLKVALEELKEESDSIAPESTVVAGKPVRSTRWWVGAAAGTVTLVAALGIAGWLWLGRSHSETTEAPPSTIPLTSYPGSEFLPTFNPDGNQVAFSWNGEKGDNYDIYIKQIGVERPMRLTDHPEIEDGPAWSPDGRWIAFRRIMSSRKYDLVLMAPIPGSPERVLAEASQGLTTQGPILSWTPDSQWLAFVDGAKLWSAVWLISLESNEKRQITFPTGIMCDGCPAFSPDGHTLAFFRWPGYEKSDLYLLDLSSDLRPKGDPRCIVVGKGRASGVDWTADGRSLVYAVYSGAIPGLWRVRTSGLGPPQRLTPIGTDGRHPAISRRGNRLVYARRTADSNIWRMEISSSKSNPPIQLVSSTRLEMQPRLSPDGKKISFVSDRSGSQEVWVCAADGSNPEQLTSFPEVTIGLGENPWSPDASQLTFAANPAGEHDVYLVNANGGGLRRLIPDRPHTNNPFWSRDGKWIYFDAVVSGNLGIYKSQADGGTPLLVTDDPGWAPMESYDGKFVYYYKQAPDGDQTNLWRVPSSGGEKKQLLDAVGFMGVQIVEDGIYFTPPEDRTSGASLQFLNTSTGKIHRVAPWPQNAEYFSVSPDRRWVVYDQLDQSGSDLMLVEKFR
jgi:eukaryotic-like serine/threonine-protein kinase